MYYISKRTIKKRHGAKLPLQLQVGGKAMVWGQKNPILCNTEVQPGTPNINVSKSGQKTGNIKSDS
jgi:hypothetical protein